MPFKINIATKEGKTFKVETENEFFIGQSLNSKVDGKEVSENLEGYEFIIKGASDKAGFASKEDIEGPGLQRVLLTKGWGMHKKQKGLRLRKTVRGSQISDKTVQINLTIEKQGSKPIAEIFPDQNKAPEPEKKEETKKVPEAVPKETEQKETPQEEPKEQPTTEEKKE